MCHFCRNSISVTLMIQKWGKFLVFIEKFPCALFPAWSDLIRFAGCSTLRSLITDLDLETPAGQDQFVKSAFLFGDHIPTDDKVGHIENSPLLRRINDRLLFLPSMERMYPLSYFLSVGCRRGLAFDLVKEKENISFRSGHPSRVQINGQLKGLRLGRFEKKDLAQEAPLPTNIFIRQFIDARSEFSAQAFRSPGWLFSGEDGWWTRMVEFVLEELNEPLVQSGLTILVLATRRGITQNYPSFFAMLERYNPDSCTFFTLVGELGFALHEMHAVSGLSFGQMPYEVRSNN
ncbi:uncharacterized protein A4U43_C02F7330 [Asparagus officinalis]|uniref:Uncharacterized protein n=1 Tax=Asparagus officinalis TaxID=4686 RepID=A0A5P1FLN7_ASPOF|nr:uncharacterized protein A4U43_C02F7330 [Asparagus officinalis]